MITALQLHTARALPNIDQKTLAEMAGVSVPTIQQMQACRGNVRGVADSSMKVIHALNRAGVELISEHVRTDDGGGGGRFRHPDTLAGRPN